MAVKYSARTRDQFSQFWKAYPERPVNPRAPALAVFDRLLAEGLNPRDLVAAAGRYAAEVKKAGIEPKFIPHARKWLHGRYFEDYLTDAPATAAVAQPSPERPPHPLDWMRDHMTAAAFDAGIVRLTVEASADSVVIVAPLSIVRDRVIQDYGHLIRRRLGDVTWRVERRDA